MKNDGIIGRFAHFKHLRDRQTNRKTDKRADLTSYRSARTHLSRQSSHGRTGSSSNAKTTRNSEMLRDGRTDGQMDGRTDTARCRVACPRLKEKDFKNFFPKF